MAGGVRGVMAASGRSRKIPERSKESVPNRKPGGEGWLKPSTTTRAHREKDWVMRCADPIALAPLPGVNRYAARTGDSARISTG